LTLKQILSSEQLINTIKIVITTHGS